MLYRSQEEINSFYSVVIEQVAKILGIERGLFQSVFELQTLIDETNKIVSTKLDSFLTTYQAWYEVHVDIDKVGTSGNLTAEQNQKLAAAIQVRDRTRDELKDALA